MWRTVLCGGSAQKLGIFFSSRSTVITTDIAARVAARFLVAQLDPAGLPRQLLDERIGEAVARLKRVLVEMRTRPDVPGHHWARELGEIVSLLPPSARQVI
jgi:hypothetical protein